MTYWKRKLKKVYKDLQKLKRSNKWLKTRNTNLLQELSDTKKKLRVVENQKILLNTQLDKAKEQKIELPETLVNDVVRSALDHLMEPVAREFKRYTDPSIWTPAALQSTLHMIQRGLLDDAYLDCYGRSVMSVVERYEDDSFVATVTIPEMRFTRYIDKQMVRQMYPMQSKSMQTNYHERNSYRDRRHFCSAPKLSLTSEGVDVLTKVNLSEYKEL